MSPDFTTVMKDSRAYLTMKEIDKLLATAYDEGKIRDYMMILTLQRTGRRISEVVGQKPYTHKVGMRPCDIHDEGYIEFDILKKNPIRQKSKKGRPIKTEKLIEMKLNKMPKRALKPVDQDYLEMIQNYILHNNIPTYERIFPITRQRADKIIKELAEKAGIARPNMKIHCHMLRHSLAIHLLKNNPNNPYAIFIVKNILDHSSINVTQHYTQFSQEDIKEALNGLYNR